MSNSKSLEVKVAGITTTGKQLQPFLQLISDLWCIVAENGYYQQLNASYWKDLLGWNESELMAKPMLALIHPEDIEATSKALSGLTKNQVIEFKTRHHHKDGTYRWISWRMNKNEDELTFGIGKEITLNEFQHKLKTRPYLEDLEVRKALEKEKELNILKSSVVNTVSHEYRTPLTNIILGVQLLKKHRDSLDNKRQMRCLEHIENSSKHLMQLVDNMLLVSKAESGKLELNRVLLNLVSFTEQLLEDLKFVRDSHHRITFIHEYSDPEAYLDYTLLRQILTNLLSNAIKYSPDGGEVNLHLACNDGVATFKIKDQGIGIPEGDKQKLFERFQRGSNAGTIRGTGLGLAIVKKCVELHDGEIWFDSVIGNGTTFYVNLPCN